MFSRISALLVVAIAVATSARLERHNHVRRNTTSTSTGGGCNTGSVQCCESVTKATNTADLLTKMGYPYNPADSVGINCTPINMEGAGESAVCQQQPVCCQNNTYRGDNSVFVGCSPFNLN